MIDYNKYYLEQAGSALPYFSGPYGQKGAGIGSFLQGLWRSVVPLFRSGAKSISKTALATAGNFLSDISSGQNVKESAKRRLAEAGEEINEKIKRKVGQMGSGKRRKTSKTYKRQRKNRKRYSRRKCAKRDIFH